MFSKLHFDLSIKNPSDGTFQYTKRYVELMSEKGLNQLMDAVGFRKQVVGKLLLKIKLKSLRQVVRQRTNTSAARSCPVSFFDILEELTPLQDLFHFQERSTEKHYDKYNKEVKYKKRSRHDYERPKLSHPKLSGSSTYRSQGTREKHHKPVCDICGRANHNTKQHRGGPKGSTSIVSSALDLAKTCTNHEIAKQSRQENLRHDKHATEKRQTLLKTLLIPLVYKKAIFSSILR